jgi:hypothetical protein
VKGSLKLVALAAALTGAASVPLRGQETEPKWTVGAEMMIGGDGSVMPGMFGVHLGRTLLTYSVISAAADVMFAVRPGNAGKVCLLQPPPYVCDTPELGSALVSSGVITIGDRPEWRGPMIRFGIGHYHAKWDGSRAGASSQTPEPSGIMFSAGVAGRIRSLARHVEAELSLRGFDRLEDRLTKTAALRFSYRF